MKASFEYKAILLKLKDQIRERGSHEQLLAYGFLRERTRLQVCDAVRYRPQTYGIPINFEGAVERSAQYVGRVIEGLGLTPNLADLEDWIKYGDITSSQVQSPVPIVKRKRNGLSIARWKW